MGRIPKVPPLMSEAEARVSFEESEYGEHREDVNYIMNGKCTGHPAATLQDEIKPGPVYKCRKCLNFRLR